MKAVVRQVYGPPDVLKFEEVATPAPADDEILIRVGAASINLGDWELLTGRPLFISVLAHLFSREQRYEFAPTSVTASKGGFFPPKAKILGTDVAGRVEAVGNNVTQFQAGDEIFGMAEGFGAFAEYVCVLERRPRPRLDDSLRVSQVRARGASAIPTDQRDAQDDQVGIGQEVVALISSRPNQWLTPVLKSSMMAIRPMSSVCTSQSFLREAKTRRLAQSSLCDGLLQGESSEVLQKIAANGRSHTATSDLADSIWTWFSWGLVFHPREFFLTVLTEWLNRRQLQIIEYATRGDENHVSPQFLLD